MAAEWLSGHIDRDSLSHGDGKFPFVGVFFIKTLFSIWD
jgi:hypothetical protein